MSITVGLLMAVATAGALLAVSLKNILHAIFGLAITLLGLSGLFLALGSPFVAAMQLLVYVGGISVAMIFAVMLSRSMSQKHEAEGLGRKIAGGLAALLFGGALVYAGATTPLESIRPAATHAFPVEPIGNALLTHYDLVFEVISLVLLVAIVASIAIAHPLRGHDDNGSKGKS